tara:strand:- start:35 stop:724 length:690 start_codon:yes stop_codon:yes gene_type:complete
MTVFSNFGKYGIVASGGSAPLGYTYLEMAFATVGGGASLSNSNRTATTNGSASVAYTAAEPWGTSNPLGRYYWEGLNEGVTAGQTYALVGLSTHTGTGYGTSFGYYNNGTSANGHADVTGGGTGFTTVSGDWLDQNDSNVNFNNSVVGFALDIPAKKFWTSWKGIWYKGGGPVNNTIPHATWDIASRINGHFFRFGNHYHGGTGGVSTFQLYTQAESQYFNDGNLMNNW